MEQKMNQNNSDLDSLIQDRPMQMMKAALPYLNNSSQKNMAFFLKFMELEHTVTLFGSTDDTISICSVPEEDEPRPLQMLTAIREYCTETEQENIDMLINYFQMLSVFV